MATLYTVHMLDVPPGSSSGAYLSAAVPASTRWVIRDILCANASAEASHINGVTVYKNSNSTVLYQVKPWDARPGRAYQYDGRAVLEAGDKIGVQLYDSGVWSVTISGFQLTLP